MFTILFILSCPMECQREKYVKKLGILPACLLANQQDSFPKTEREQICYSQRKIRK